MRVHAGILPAGSTLTLTTVLSSAVSVSSQYENGESAHRHTARTWYVATASPCQRTCVGAVFVVCWVVRVALLTLWHDHCLSGLRLEVFPVKLVANAAFKDCVCAVLKAEPVDGC